MGIFLSLVVTLAHLVIPLYKVSRAYKFLKGKSFKSVYSMVTVDSKQRRSGDKKYRSIQAITVCHDVHFVKDRLEKSM